ncbi:hypothetical protein [Brevibacillus formosus]
MAKLENTDEVLELVEPHPVTKLNATSMNAMVFTLQEVHSFFPNHFSTW